LHALGAAGLALACLVAGAWGALALWFQFPGGALARGVAVAAWCVPWALALRASLTPGRRWRSLAVFAAGLVLLLGWWTTIQPRQDRAWADDVAQPVLIGGVARADDDEGESRHLGAVHAQGLPRCAREADARECCGELGPGGGGIGSAPRGRGIRRGRKGQDQRIGFDVGEGRGGERQLRIRHPPILPRALLGCSL